MVGVGKTESTEPNERIPLMVRFKKALMLKLRRQYGLNKKKKPMEEEEETRDYTPALTRL